MAVPANPPIHESRLERHMQSPYAAHHIFADDRIKKATLPSRDSLTLAYVIHESNDPDDSTEAQEVRIVLTMGYSYRKEEWAPAVDALLTQWKTAGIPGKLKILTLDNRGVGHSDAPWGRYTTHMMAADLLALLDHLQWPTAHFVGISMGGMISQELVLQAPQRVLSLTLLVTTQGKFCPEYAALRQIVVSTFSRDPATITSNIVEFLYPAAFVNTPIDDGTHRTMRDVLYEYHTSGNATRGPPGAAGTLGQSWALVSHWVDDDRLSPVRTHGYPITIVGCPDDQAIVYSHTVKLRNVLYGDHVVNKDYEVCGHALFLQVIDEVGDDILQCVKRGMANQAAKGA